jgi:two-component system sensor histidine kinase/response regulator
VEDNAISRELICDWLESEGYEVTAVGDLQASFNAMTNRVPNVVLLDINLGNEDGLCLVQWMRQQPGMFEIPVIALTAHAMAAERERILRAGCNACLSKPIDFQRMREGLNRRLLNAKTPSVHP